MSLMMKQWMRVGDDWKVFEKWLDEMMKFEMVWDGEERSFGVVSVVGFFLSLVSFLPLHSFL